MSVAGKPHYPQPSSANPAVNHVTVSLIEAAVSI
jgi:hypothetical protein